MNWLIDACKSSYAAYLRRKSPNTKDGITIIRQNGKTRYIGIQKEARRLGVSRVFLWMVLTGQATSKRVSKSVRIKEV